MMCSKSVVLTMWSCAIIHEPSRTQSALLVAEMLSVIYSILSSVIVSLLKTYFYLQLLHVFAASVVVVVKSLFRVCMVCWQVFRDSVLAWYLPLIMWRNRKVLLQMLNLRFNACHLKICLTALLYSHLLVKDCVLHLYAKAYSLTGIICQLSRLQACERSRLAGSARDQSMVCCLQVRHLTRVWTWLLLLTATLIPSIAANKATKRRDIYLVGLFPLSGNMSSVGRGVRPAVELALKHVNNKEDILSDYQLKVAFNDTMCDMAVATKAFFDMTYDNTTTDAMLFGDACYSVTGPMAEISREWDMFQLSYGDTDPVLSDRDKYPNFFRTVPSDSEFNPARLALIRHFNWTQVGTIFQDASKGSARYGYAHNKFDSLMEMHKINITKAESFADDPSSAIENLKKYDVRIIVGNFDQNMARRVFCSAHERGMYGPRHQWIILGTYSHDWWKQYDSDVPCTPEVLNDTIDGYLATDLLPLSTDTEMIYSTLTPQKYEELYNEARGKDYSVYHGFAYDGIWVIAHALDKILSNPKVYTGTTLEQLLRGEKVGKALNDTNIRGVTGRIQFNNGDRVGEVNILQMQGGEMVKIAEYSAFTDQLNFSKGRPIIWRGGRVPMDRTIQYEEMRRVTGPLYLTMVALASAGIIMAFCFLGLNIHFRRHRYIKMSSPNMNNLIVVGCILCYFSIVLLGTDTSSASSSPVVFTYWCRARTWVLALGFTLAFGAMFSKTWRVHAIFTNIKLNKKVIKDYKLMLIVLVLLMLDVAILITWQIIDPFQKAEKRLKPEVLEDHEVIPVLEYCSSQHMEIWLGSIYAYKGILLAFGCFLAWETRHVSISALNDSKYIGLSVYNVVIMCTCGGAVTFIIRDQPTHSFVIIAVFIMFATTATLCLVFVPKIIQLRRDPKGDDKRIRATLRKPSRKVSDEDDRYVQKVRLATEENRRLRGFLEQKASELERLLDQLGDEATKQDLFHKSVLHRKVMELRTTSNISPSRVSRVSSQSDADMLSTMSDISGTTATLLVTESPPGGRQYKSRILNNRTYMEIMEMSDMRLNKQRKSSITIPPPAEEEEEEDDPFGGVYVGPPDTPVKRHGNDHWETCRYNETPNIDHVQMQLTVCEGAPVHHIDNCPRRYSDISESDEDNNDLLRVPNLPGLATRHVIAHGRHVHWKRRHSAPMGFSVISEAGEDEQVSRKDDEVEQRSFEDSIYLHYRSDRDATIRETAQNTPGNLILIDSTNYDSSEGHANDFALSLHLETGPITCNKKDSLKDSYLTGDNCDTKQPGKELESGECGSCEKGKKIEVKYFDQNESKYLTEELLRIENNNSEDEISSDRNNQDASLVSGVTTQVNRALAIVHKSNDTTFFEIPCNKETIESEQTVRKKEVQMDSELNCQHEINFTKKICEDNECESNLTQNCDTKMKQTEKRESNLNTDINISGKVCDNTDISIRSTADDMVLDNTDLKTVKNKKVPLYFSEEDDTQGDFQIMHESIPDQSQDHNINIVPISDLSHLMPSASMDIPLQRETEIDLSHLMPSASMDIPLQRETEMSDEKLEHVSMELKANPSNEIEHSLNTCSKTVEHALGDTTGSEHSQLISLLPEIYRLTAMPNVQDKNGQMDLWEPQSTTCITSVSPLLNRLAVSDCRMLVYTLDPSDSKTSDKMLDSLDSEEGLYNSQLDFQLHLMDSLIGQPEKHIYLSDSQTSQPEKHIVPSSVLSEPQLCQPEYDFQTSQPEYNSQTSQPNYDSHLGFLNSQFLPANYLESQSNSLLSPFAVSAAPPDSHLRHFNSQLNQQNTQLGLSESRLSPDDIKLRFSNSLFGHHDSSADPDLTLCNNPVDIFDSHFNFPPHNVVTTMPICASLVPEESELQFSGGDDSLPSVRSTLSSSLDMSQIPEHEMCSPITTHTPFLNSDVTTGDRSKDNVMLMSPCVTDHQQCENGSNSVSLLTTFDEQPEISQWISESSTISTPVPRELSAISSPVPRELSAISSQVPRELSAISSPVPCELSAISSPVPCELSAISSPVPCEFSAISSPVPCELSAISSPVPSPLMSTLIQESFIKQANTTQTSDPSSIISVTPSVRNSVCSKNANSSYPSSMQTSTVECRVPLDVSNIISSASEIEVEPRPNIGLTSKQSPHPDTFRTVFSSSQVFPEKTVFDGGDEKEECAQSGTEVQNQELWACPANGRQSKSATSSRRVSFTCDVIEDI